MKSLFAKILVWFLATTVISAVGSVIIFRLSDPELANSVRRFGQIAAFQVGEAQHFYETGGGEALAAFMERLNSVYPSESFFTDRNGRDLLTGEDRSELVRAAMTTRPGPFTRVEDRYIARASADGRYWLFVPAALGRPLFRIFLPWSMWAIPFIVVLCYALARHLAAPLRGLEKAVQRFGKGDFSARVESTRRDELGQLARTFDQMAERIETLVAGQRQLLLDISHELRSPLTRLGLAVELSRSEGRDDKTLDRIQKEVDRLNTLIGEILGATRSETVPSKILRESVRLDRLLANLLEICSVEANSKPCRLELTASQPLSIDGDEELLRKAFENVIRNAIRYAPENTEVEIRLQKTESWIFIQIRDHGPGVPEESLPHLFDPFYRVENDRSRSSGGVGLGLAIACRSIERHGGLIQARNVHPGFLVEIYLPPVASPVLPQSTVGGISMTL